MWYIANTIQGVSPFVSGEVKNICVLCRYVRFIATRFVLCCVCVLNGLCVFNGVGLFNGFSYIANGLIVCV